MKINKSAAATKKNADDINKEHQRQEHLKNNTVQRHEKFDDDKFNFLGQFVREMTTAWGDDAKSKLQEREETGNEKNRSEKR